MIATENNKNDVIGFVYNAKLALENTSQCFVMDELVDLPEAFHVVEKHLHTLRTTFTSIYTKLNGESLSGMYPNTSNTTTQDYCSHIAYVKQFLEIFKCPYDNSELKMMKYQRAVQDNNGMGLEQVMLHLINCAMVVAKKPLVTDKQKEGLKGAQNEVKDLPPLYDDNPTGGVAINHHSSGHQFNYNGTGHQNICNGGFQITGNNDRSVYNYIANSNEMDES